MLESDSIDQKVLAVPVMPCPNCGRIVPEHEAVLCPKCLRPRCPICYCERCYGLPGLIPRGKKAIPFSPSPEELAELLEEVQATWDERERERRLAGPGTIRWFAPEVRTPADALAPEWQSF